MHAHSDLLAWLRLQNEWGADEALEAAPLDRLRTMPLASAAHVAPADARIQPRRPLAGTTPADRAAAAVSRANTLEELRAVISAFDECALRDTAASLVFAEGDPATGLLLVSDPPGEAEDSCGTPFAGADGELLDRMLGSVALSRAAFLRAPLIPWRPPGGRSPNPGEIALCLPFLHRLITLTMPRRVVIAGALPSRILLNATRRYGQPLWTGMEVPAQSAQIPALAMPSPSMVARTSAARRQAWAALRLLRRTLDAEAR